MDLAGRALTDESGPGADVQFRMNLKSQLRQDSQHHGPWLRL